MVDALKIQRRKCQKGIAMKNKTEREPETEAKEDGYRASIRELVAQARPKLITASGLNPMIYIIFMHITRLYYTGCSSVCHSDKS